MRRAPPALRSAIQGPVLALLPFLLSACPPPQMAPNTHGPPIYFWGIRRDCKRDALLSVAVEKRLGQLGDETRRVWPPPGLENARPALAALEYTRSCEIKEGILIGGHVEERSLGRDTPVTLMRLWRVDLASHKLTFRDHFCRACELSRILATQVAYLAEEGGASDSGDTKAPTFCFESVPDKRPNASTTLGDPQLPLTSPAHGDPLLLSLNVGSNHSPAERKLREKLFDALRTQLGLTGRESQLVEADRATGLPVQAQPKLLRGQARQAVHVEVQTTGKGSTSRALTLRVAQAGTETQAMVFECADCDDAALTSRLVHAVPRFLDEVTPPASSLARLPLPPELQGVLCSSRQNSGLLCPGSDGKNLDSGPMPYPFHGALCGESIDVPLDGEGK